MLTKISLLNAATGIVDQFSRVIVGFVVTPILVTQLGASIFGIWQIILKISNQLAPLDGRSQEVLKWTVANKQNSNDILEKKRAVGSALVCLLYFSPLLLISYLLAIYWLPDYLKLSVEQTHDAKLTLGILCVNAYLFALALIFESVIRGMNLSYKLLGLRAVIVSSGGVVTVLAVYMDYGLVGVALGQLIVGVISLLAYFIIVKRLVPWFGVYQPIKSEIKVALNRSKWFTLWEILSVWMMTGEVIMLGLLSNSEVVSKYVLTMYATQMITVVVLTGVYHAMPGLGGIIGAGDFRRAATIRRESLLYSWWISLAICCTVIIYNESFVALWVGREQYAGATINLLITICVLQLVFIRQDEAILKLALDIKKNVILGFISSLVTLLLMLVLVKEYQLIGLCVALLLGRGILSIAYSVIISRFLKVKQSWLLSIKYFVITALMILISWELSKIFMAEAWGQLIFQSSVWASFFLLVLFYFAMNKEQKNKFTCRLTSVIKPKNG